METTSPSAPPSPSKPLLIYDGDCKFCVYWALYWQKLTEDRVAYAPYQEVAEQHPAIPRENFRRAVQYIAPDGKVASAAEASFLTLSHAPSQRFWLALYRRLPGFAWLSECLYRFIAARRSLFYRPSLLLWGRAPEPPRYDLMAWLFLRGLGLIYLSAFISFGVQAPGLIGAQGILPLGDFTGALQNQLGAERYWLAPMVFWLNHGNAAISAACWVGAGAALLLVFNILPRLSLFLLYALYLSLLYAGQSFMTYQWDAFLLETGFLGLILALNGGCGRWLLRWLLFRFMFLSGTCKLMSGDPTWANLTALSYHFQTQPLPTPLAWYAHQLPAATLVFFTGAALFTELALPWLIFCPRRLRFVAAGGFLALETAIFLTGNYNFFNLLTMLLCLSLFDDTALFTLAPRRLAPWFEARRQKPLQAVRLQKTAGALAGLLALLIVFASGVQLAERFGAEPPQAFIAVKDGIGPLHIASTYGLFAVMTTHRPEIILEGSADGVHWKEYGFRFKPGDLGEGARWNIPHQPRLDWQLWFAALENPSQNPWFPRLLRRMLENAPDVMALFGENPFSAAPPRFVRALLYEYRFATAKEREETGLYWQRKLLGLYYPAARLRENGDQP